MIVLDWPAEQAPITVGDLTTNNAMALGADLFQGTVFQAAASGTINFLTIIGGAGTSAVDYRLVIYAATSTSNISGAKLGETAITNGLTAATPKKVALQAPVSIVAGQWYALGIQPSASMACASNTANNGRFFADAYSDGALGTAPASSSNGTAAPAMSGTTA